MSWFLSVLAVSPLVALVLHAFDVSDWETWALIAAGFWWRILGSINDRAEAT